MLRKSKFILAILYIVSSVFIACGGSSSEPGGKDYLLTGKFIDAAVSGITYTTASQNGTTELDGSFKYKQGETITFKVGKVVLGSATAKELITPLDLVSGATDYTNTAVLNIVRFLLSINSSTDPAVITISDAVKTAFDADGCTLDFTTDLMTQINAIPALVDALNAAFAENGKSDMPTNTEVTAHVASMAAFLPVFTPAQGSYVSAQDVTIAASGSGVSIYYTTDGETPTASSTRYTSAIPVTSTTTIKAIGTDGTTTSPVISAEYIIGADVQNPYEDYSWKLIGLLGTTTDTMNARPYSMVIGSDNVPVVAFRDSNKSDKLTAKKYAGTDTTWNVMGTVGFTGDEVRWISMDQDSTGKLYVGYYDAFSRGNGTVRYWSGTAWTSVGNAGDAAVETFDHGILNIGSDNKPSVVYRDATDKGFWSTGKKWSGTAWENIGTESIPRKPSRLSQTFWKKDGVNEVNVVAIETSNIPDTTGDSAVSIDFFVYNSVLSKWESINQPLQDASGNSSLVSGYETGYSTLASYGDKLYIAFKDGYYGGKLCIRVWDPTYPNSVGPNGNWNRVSDEISSGEANHLAMIFDNAGNIIVAYSDADNDNKVTVKKRIDYNWVTLGEEVGLLNNPQEGFSFGKADWISLAVDSANTTYVAYRDIDNNNTITVMKFTDTAGTTTLSTPLAPGVVTATGGVGSLALSWDAVTNATAYEVYYSTTNNNTTPAPTKVDVSGTTHTITGLANNTIYYIWLKAKNLTGTSDFGAGSSGTTQDVTPASPGAAAITPSTSSMALTWTAVNGATSYEVYYSISNNSGGATGPVNVAGTSTSISGLTENTQYYVWLKAKNGTLTSAFGPMATAKTTATPKSWKFLGGKGFSASKVYNSDITVDDAGNVYIVTSDGGKGWALTVQKWDKDNTDDTVNSWTYMGDRGFNGKDSGGQIKVKTEDQPYVVTAGTAAYGTAVYTYNGFAWIPYNLTSTAFAGDYHTSIMLDTAGKPAVGIFNRTNSNVQVKKLTGAYGSTTPTDWINLGTTITDTNIYTTNGTTPKGNTYWYSMGMVGDNPVLAVMDRVTNPNDLGQPEFMKWNGSAWGTPVKVPGANQFWLSHYIQSDSAGNVYASFTNSSCELIVQKYDSGTSTWSQLGTGSAAHAAAHFSFMQLDSNNNPVVAYIGYYSKKLTVRKWNGTVWETLGSTDFALLNYQWLHMVVDTAHGDKIYLVYNDPEASDKATVLAWK